MPEPVTKQAIMDALSQLDEHASPEEIKKAISAKLTTSKIWTSPQGRRVFTASLVLAILTPVLICLYHTEKWLMLSLYAAWSIGPPVWFLYEYVWIFPDEYKFDTTQFGDLKYIHV